MTIPTCQTLDELRDKLDQSLFRSAKYNPDHVLHRHLSPRKQTGYNLRDKSHNLTLPQSVNATLKQNFVERMVYFWSIPIGLLTKLPYALVTFSSLYELTIMRLSFLLEQLVSLPDMGLYGGGPYMAPLVPLCIRHWPLCSSSVS